MLRDGELGLEVLNFLLSRLGYDPRNLVSQLEITLSEGGSAWKVAQVGDAARLERRVDDTVRKQYDEAAASAAPSTAEHLRSAWRYLYGRNPDPSEAYDLAVKAVETVVAPVIVPDDPRPTLGKAKNALRDGMHNFEMEWASQQDQTGLDTVLRMMESLWTGQHDRHGKADSSEPTSVSNEEAQAAVHVAISLIQIFNAELIKRVSA